MRGRMVARSLVAAVCVIGFLAGQLSPAHADPSPNPVIPTTTPRTVAEAQKLIKQLEELASQVGEDYEAATEAVTKAEGKVKASEKAVADQQAVVDTLTQQAREIALTQFQGRNISTTLQIFSSSDPDTFLNQLSTVNKIDQNMNDALQQQQLEQAALADLQRGLNADLASLKAEKEREAQLKSDVDKAAARAKAQYDRLTAPQRAAVAGSDGASIPASGATVSGDANGRAIAAARWAISKVGRASYRWGGAGPSGFDCSGLMLAAYRSVGVSLPHSSRSQSRIGRSVSRSELKPGDLLFWYHPVHHVSMYIGNGRMVHAANTRLDLRIQSVSGYGAPFAGARRILG